MPGIMLNAYMTYLNLTTTLWGRRYYYLHFANGKLKLRKFK